MGDIRVIPGIFPDRGLRISLMPPDPLDWK